MSFPKYNVFPAVLQIPMTTSNSEIVNWCSLPVISILFMTNRAARIVNQYTGVY